MLSGHPSQNGDQATLLSRRQLAPHWRWSRHRRHDASEATRKRRAVLSLSPQVVPQAQRETDLLLYLGWWIEVLHRELKQELGWGRGQLLSPRSVARQAPFVAFLYTVIVAWYAQYAAGQPWARWHVGPWYTHKKHPSFRDMIAAVKRLIIAAREYSYEVDDDDFPQVFQTLAHAAGHLPVTLAITVEAA